MPKQHSNCVFCKIVKGELHSFKVYEDEEFLAVLDINPNTEGTTVLMSKQHYPSYIIDLDEENFCKFFRKAKRVAKILDERLASERCAIVLEGTGIDHAHLKIYPMHGIKKGELKESSKRVFYDEYPGFVTTALGPPAGRDELEKVAKKIWE
jgi:histidine triad (HIT) family protein